jgi:hypothetical protein
MGPVVSSLQVIRRSLRSTPNQDESAPPLGFVFEDLRDFVELRLGRSVVVRLLQLGKFRFRRRGGTKPQRRLERERRRLDVEQRCSGDGG